jgi:hypothetical protein
MKPRRIRGQTCGLLNEKCPPTTNPDHQQREQYYRRLHDWHTGAVCFRKYRLGLSLALQLVQLKHVDEAD